MAREKIAAKIEHRHGRNAAFEGGVVLHKHVLTRMAIGYSHCSKFCNKNSHPFYLLGKWFESGMQ